MNIDALPKILFLHEESEQMSDRRIRCKVEYDTTSDPPKKVTTKKINNTIDLKEKISQTDDINCLAYSNKLGVLITCSQDEILLTDFSHLEQYLATQDISKKSLKDISKALSFRGKVYLPPSQTKFLAVSEEKIFVYDLISQKIVSETKNEFDLRHFTFITEESVVGWKFHSHAYIYEEISMLQKSKRIEQIQMCTTVNLIKKHVVICDKIRPNQDDEDSKLYVMDRSCSQVLNEIELSKYENPECMFFNFAQIISIFVIQSDSKDTFKQNDVYGIVLGFYDDFQEMPDRRYLNFMKGNISEKDSELEIRGLELFLSPNEDRSFYYDSEGVKTPFQVQVVETGNIKIILIEKLENIFVVDSSTEFEKMNLYTLLPSHEIKLEGQKYFKGMCLMKNMLQAQKVPPKKDSNDICDMICKDFNGQFLSLYFPAKQTELTVPFPASILALGDNKIQRRYAIETVLGVQEDKVDKIKEGIQKIKSSPYIEKITNPIDLSDKNLILTNQSKLEDKKQLKEQKMSIGEEKPSLLSNLQKPNSLGGNSLFGQTNNKGSLFNTQSIFDSNPKSNVQEVKPESKNMGSIFSNNLNNQGGNALFGASNQGIFGSNSQSVQKDALNLFGQKEKVEEQKSPFPTATQQNKQQAKPFLFNLKPQQTGPLAPKSQPQLNISAEQPQQQSKPSKDLFSRNNVVKLFNKDAKKQIKEEPVKISDRIQLFPEEQSQLHEEERQVIQEKEEKLSNKPQKIDISPQIPYSKTDQQPKHKRISFSPPSQQDQVPKPKLSKEQSIENERLAQKNELNKKRQNLEPKQPVSTNIKKLQQLSVLMGHKQYQNMPGPLKLLTDEQIDALIYTFNSLGKVQENKEQSKKSKEQLARQKLLKIQHFGKMLKQFDDTAQFIKSVKQANKSITSPSLFTISNAKQLLKNLSQFPKIPKLLTLKQSKPQNPLYNLVKNYTARMEFFQNQYTSLQHERYSENKNPNALDNSSQIIERKVKENLEKLQEKVKYLAYYNHNVYPQKLAFRRDQLTYRQSEDKWFDIVQEKIDECNELEVKVQKLISTVEPMLSRNTSMKSSSIVTNISQKNKKKCHFVFNSENLSSSDDQVSSVSVNHIYESSQESQLYPPSKKCPLLIKFKPKPIVIDQNSLDTITLVKLAEQSTLVTNQKMYQDLFNRTNSVNSNGMQSSTMKKSIDFRDKIPLRKSDQDEKKVAIKKIDYSAFDSSPEDSGSDRDNSDEEENVPDMGRSVSFVPSKPPVTQQKSNIKIKKTEQKQVQGQLAKQTQKVASVFTGGPKKEEQKQIKKQEKPIGQGSLFGGLTTGPNLNIGLDKKQNQPEEKTEGKKKFGLDATGLTGLFQKNNQTKPTTTQSAPKVEQKQGSLFGNLTQNSGGLMSNMKKLEQKQDVEQNKPVQKVNQAKNTGFPKIPSSSGLFGKVQTTDNVKNQTVSQSKPAQTIPIVKKQEKKPASESLFGSQGGLFGKQNQNEKPSLASSSLFSNKQDNKANNQAKKKPQQKQTGDQAAAMAAGLFNKSSEPSKENVSAIDQKKSGEQSVSFMPKQEGTKSATNISVNEPKKEQSSLFGGSNSGLFGSSGLTGKTSFGGVSSIKKQETKDSDKPGNADSLANVAKDEKKPEQKSSALFGSGNTSSLFGQSNVPKPQQGGLFGTVSKPVVQSDEKKAQDTQEADSKGTSLFGNKQPENQNSTQVKPQSQPIQQSQTFVAPSFGVSSASSTGSGLTASFGQKPTPTFGGTNKFMTQPQQGSQATQNQPWVPASSSFQQPASTQLKSFASIGNTNQTGNLFGQSNQQQNQQQNTQVSSQQQNQPFLFSQNQSQSLFGSNPLNNNAFSGAQTGNNLFNNSQQQPQQGMFGQSSGLFGGNNAVNQAPQQGGNFLSGFNPTANQTIAQPTAGTALFKPRK